MSTLRRFKYTTVEGGQWQELMVHSIEMPDGSQWDAVNGWRNDGQETFVELVIQKIRMTQYRDIFDEEFFAELRALVPPVETQGSAGWRPIEALVPVAEQKYLLSDGQAFWTDKWSDRNWADQPQQHWSMGHYYPKPIWWQSVILP